MSAQVIPVPSTFVTYEALADCRHGGCFRREGEIFLAPDMPDKDVPGHLRKVAEKKAAAQEDVGLEAKVAALEAQLAELRAAANATVPKGARVTAADLGGKGNAKNVADITSADMLKK
jgi:hypothetical protein